MQSNSFIYLDAAATTPCCEEATSAMVEYSNLYYGNPASSHQLGRIAKDAIIKNGNHIAHLLGCFQRELTFTSGATESNNIVILGCAKLGRKSNIIISPIDHKSTLMAANELENRGIEIRRMKVLKDGRIDTDHLSSIVDMNTALLSVSFVNSEIGTIQNLYEIRAILNNSTALFHIDATQALGKIPINVKDIGVDCASISAHKIEGPKGIGALYTSPLANSRLQPITFGGGQSGLRSGTLPTQLIAGFGAAAKRISNRCFKKSWEEAAKRRKAILDIMQQNRIPLLINSSEKYSVPHILNFSLPEIPANTLISRLHQVCISSGSACNSNTLTPSYVITGIGHDSNRANSALRLSYTSTTNIEQIRMGAEIIAKTAKQLSQLRMHND